MSDHFSLIYFITIFVVNLVHLDSNGGVHYYTILGIIQCFVFILYPKWYYIEILYTFIPEKV